MEDIFEKVKEMLKNSGLNISGEQIETAFQQISRGERLKEKGFSDEMIELLQNISNEEKIDELMYKIIPSIKEIEESPELQKAKLEMSNFSTICSEKYDGDRMECSTHYRELQEKIKMLEMKHIRTEYGRLLNNYYMTLAQYLVQCREFETSGTVEKNFFGRKVNVPGLIPPNYDKQKKELETKMNEYYSNNCHGNWRARGWGCSDIIREKERLENALGINGLRKLWDDFVGVHTPKDLKGNPINPEELKEIYENIQYFAPLVLSEERLPEETDEYFDRRQKLIKIKSGECFKSDRLSNLTMVIGSRYELNKFIKGLGSFGNLLYLTLESGLFEFVEEELGMGQGGGGKKRKSRKRKTRKKKKSKIKSKKYKKKSKKKFRGQGGGLSKNKKLILIIVLYIIATICIIVGGNLLLAGLGAIKGLHAGQMLVIGKGIAGARADIITGLGFKVAAMAADRGRRSLEKSIEEEKKDRLHESELWKRDMQLADEKQKRETQGRIHGDSQREWGREKHELEQKLREQQQEIALLRKQINDK